MTSASDLVLLPPAIVNAVLSLYKDDFIYVNSNDLIYNKSDFVLHGKIVQRGARYFKAETHSKIFDNGEAIIAANQIRYLLGVCFLYLNLDNQPSLSRPLSAYNKVLGKLIIKDESLIFTKPISYSNKESFSFSANISFCRQTHKGLLLELIIQMGPENNFLIKTHGFLLSKDLHGFVEMDVEITDNGENYTGSAQSH